MLQSIITKILLGISLAASMGPVTTEMIKRGLTSGFWGSFSVRLGGAISNSFCLLIAYFGLGQLMQHQIILFTVSCIGSCLLIYMGISTIIKINAKNFTSVIEINDFNNKNNKIKHNYSIKNGLLVGCILSLTSPIGLMFWLSTFAANIEQDLTAKFQIYDLLINFFIIAGVLLWGAFFSFMLHFFNKIIDDQKLRIISILSALILIYFGVKYGITNFNRFNHLIN